MAEQEEIKEIFTKYRYDGEYTLDIALKDLSDLGVVIKVERELPIHKVDFPDALVASAYREGCLSLLDAGYVAVEPLIKG